MKTQKTDNSDPVKKQIEEALTSSNQIQFEEMPDENSSPLNQPVVEKSIDDSSPSSTANPAKGNSEEGDADTDSSGENFTEEPSSQEEGYRNSVDAPEQEIHQADRANAVEGVEIPLSHAQMAADTLLGVTDNILEVGGGFFISIRKHEDFYEFDEVIEVIDEQNVKNIRRFRLDADDKALLRPLLIVIIRKRAKVLTPEQQLAAAVVSILVKKFRLAMQVRAENEILVQRIRDIIKTESANNRETNSSASQEANVNHDSRATPNINPEFGPYVLEVAD
jgi:hypothetical protein